MAQAQISGLLVKRKLRESICQRRNFSKKIKMEGPSKISPLKVDVDEEEIKAWLGGGETTTTANPAKAPTATAEVEAQQRKVIEQMEALMKTAPPPPPPPRPPSSAPPAAAAAAASSVNHPDIVTKGEGDNAESDGNSSSNNSSSSSSSNSSGSVNLCLSPSHVATQTQKEKVVEDLVHIVGIQLHYEPSNVKEVMPKRMTEGSAGCDLYLPTAKHLAPSIILQPQQRTRLVLGLSWEPPPHLFGMVFLRSSMCNLGLTQKSNGIIDSDFRGIICVDVKNDSPLPIELKKGERVFQVIWLPIIKVEFELRKSLSSTTRGVGGFGSTGVF